MPEIGHNSKKLRNTEWTTGIFLMVYHSENVSAKKILSGDCRGLSRA
jgi:hypothetical protein